MTSPHVHDDVLAQFVAAALPEADAVRVAEHLDACPACAARAQAHDPLHAVFVRFDDPAVPDDLVSATLARLEGSPRLGPEPVLALGLLAVATGVLVTGGDLPDLLASVLALARAVTAAGSALFGDVSIAAPVWVALALTALAWASLVSRAVEQRRTA